jgi:general stress protein 26
MDQQQQRAWEIMKSIGSCFFITKAGNDEMHGRPMAPVVRPEEGKIYLLTHESDDKTSDHALADGVLLVFADSTRHLALNATASVSRNAAKLEELWSPAATAFWPDGPKTPGVVAVEIEPTHCEYWDGKNPVVSAFKLMYARATKTKPDLGDNRKLAM